MDNLIGTQKQEANFVEKTWEKLESLFEERAAILQYESGYSEYEAEQLAAQMYNFANKSQFKKYIQKLKAEAKV